EQQQDKLSGQAQKAMEIGREDLAREALTRKSGLTQQINDLQSQHEGLQGEEQKLTLASQRLQAKVDAFRTKKETLKATYNAAEAFSASSEGVGDVGRAVQRDEDKTASLQDRAGAVDELLASGALEHDTGKSKDDIPAQLDALSSDSDVEMELQRMRDSLPAG